LEGRHVDLGLRCDVSCQISELPLSTECRANSRLCHPEPLPLTQIRIVNMRNTKVYPKVSGLSHNEINNNNNKHSLEAIQKVMAAKLTRLTHKIAIQVHIVTESCTICSFSSGRPVGKLLDTLSYHVKTP